MPSSTSARTAGPSARRCGSGATTVVVSALIAVLATGCGGPAARTDSAPPPVVSGAPAAANSSNAPAVDDAGTAARKGSSLVATAQIARVTVRSGPDGGKQSTLKHPTAAGAPLTFRVLERRPGWLKVQLPIRPNGSSGWVAESDVVVTSTPYRLIISMDRHRLDVLREGRRIARHEVGVGKVATPTPKGTYYLTELIQPPDPKGSYGPYAFGLSAFSETLKTFAGGPGQLGLHGTDAPHGLGTDISHGCIRVSNAVITELAADLPLGTPIEIRS
jgi:lipoprotein-anchoring transpeptidase ErfK/SrfK